jgi:hypothetical protein
MSVKEPIMSRSLKTVRQWTLGELIAEAFDRMEPGET